MTYGNCSSLKILTENRDKTIENELKYFKWNQIKGHLFVTSSSLYISCDFNLSSKMRIIYGVYFLRGKWSFCGVNQNLICPHALNILLRFTWCVSVGLASSFLKRSLLSKGSGSLKKADMLYVLGIWWQGLFITWWTIKLNLVLICVCLHHLATQCAIPNKITLLAE